MARPNSLYQFFEENRHVNNTEYLIQKAQEVFPNKSRKELVARCNYWIITNSLGLNNTEVDR